MKQTYVIAAWKRKRQNAKTLTSGEKASWLVGWQEAGVPASVHAHPVHGGEENPSVMSEETKSAREHRSKGSLTHGRDSSLQLRQAEAAEAASICSRWLPATAPRLLRHTSFCCLRSPRTLPGLALPTMPFCVFRHHQNCPSAPTKIGASSSVGASQANLSAQQHTKGPPAERQTYTRVQGQTETLEQR